MQVNGSNWSCSVCTFENVSALANCEICGSGRKRIELNSRSASSPSSLKRVFGSVASAAAARTSSSSSSSLSSLSSMSSSSSLTQSLLCSVGNCVENEGKKIQRKVQQLRELGIELASNELMMLLARNCYSVHAAASEYFEKGWQQQQDGNKPSILPAELSTKENLSAHKVMLEQLETKCNDPTYRLIGKTTTGAYVTRKGVCLQEGQQVQVKAEIGGRSKRPRTTLSNGPTPSTGFVRIETQQHLQIGRINRDVETLLFPLLREELLRVHAVCVDIPTSLDVFAPFKIVLVVQVHVHAFRIFDDNHRLFHFSTRLFDALEFVQSGQIDGSFPEENEPEGESPLPQKRDGEVNGVEQEEQEAAASASDQVLCYGSNASRFESMHAVLEPYAQSSDAIAPLLYDTTLKQHQKQALVWMLWRENQTRYGSDANSTDVNESSNPFWHRRRLNGTLEDGYYVNFVEKRACLKLPPPAEPCLGGILADEMGLGKTLSMIALVLYEKCNTRQQQETGQDQGNDQDSPKQSFQLRTLRSQKKQGHTLVVCPLSLLHQWHHEIEARVASSAQLSCHVYYGVGRDEEALMSSSDIVLTTYGILSSEFEKKSSNGQGALLARTWQRVILDEAHSIKSRTTTYFNACSALTARHRWCLTGTPIQNSIDDIYSLLCFLQYKPWCHAAWWQRVIENPNTQNADPAAMIRLKTLLSPILLRRTKNCRDATGKRLVQLPPKHVETVTLTFSRQERAFYQAVYGQTQAEFNGFVANGTANKSYMAIFALLLRLRQACDHPYLVLGKDVVDSATNSAATEVDPGSASHGENLKSDEDQFTAMQLFFSRHLQQQKQQNAKVDGFGITDQDYQCRSSTTESTEDTVRYLTKKNEQKVEYGSEANQGLLSQVFVKNTLLQIEEEGIDSQECPICLDVPREPVLTSCAHLLCDQCLEDYCFSQESPMCPVCRAPIERSQCFSLNSSTKTCSNGSSNSSSDLSLALTQRQNQMLSTKMRQLLHDLQQFRLQQQQERPQVEEPTSDTANKTGEEPPTTSRKKKKVVVFSQWTHMLDLIVNFLQQHDFVCLRFDGSLACDARDKVLTKFTNDPTVDVLVISLKAGGVGLNLTAASMVVLLDPWWNPAVEQQAIDRVHRLGKTDPVIVKKYIVEDTIEEMICSLQKRKEAIMKNVLIVSSSSQQTQQGNQPERLLQMEDLIAFFSRKA